MTLGKVLFIMALAGTLMTHPHVSAAHEELLPQVAVLVIAAPDGFQMEWDGAVLQEHGEEWCGTARCVNDVLSRIGQDYTYSVTWTLAKEG